jgi:hypothetical protein
MRADGEERRTQGQSRLRRRESAEKIVAAKHTRSANKYNQGRALKREEGRQSADFSRKRDRRRMYSV